MPRDLDVFNRFLAARRADPDRIPPRAVALAETLRGALLGNRPATTVPDAELRRLLDGLPDDPTPAGYDEDQALGSLAMTSEALRMALDSREAGLADNAASRDGELHHLARRVLESVAVVLTQREPSIAHPVDKTQPEGS
ncbi:hypothetical protein [Streptomyces sp. S1D4-20]|uniref:hypothetical protein n=1 Tax=Streptomyces sp. S1D4-20 TaxID=2594462 RepID=UPI001163F5C1|nr:hypothetical protein [Streptomyces sp. S1D4-20]QDN54020.1 hypothetical protein FNV67_00085 [Streptomyces sp. S1D4-20]